jgi:hypothetical protein
MRRHLQPLPNAPGLAAVMNGPIVLAGRLGTEGLSAGADLIVNERDSGKMLDIPIATPKLAESTDVELVPWYRIAHERYTLYWSV